MQKRTIRDSSRVLHNKIQVTSFKVSSLINFHGVSQSLTAHNLTASETCMANALFKFTLMAKASFSTTSPDSKVLKLTRYGLRALMKFLEMKLKAP